MNEAGIRTSGLSPAARHEIGLILAVMVVLGLATAGDANHIYWFRPWPSAVEIARQTSMLGIFALGAAIVIISGGIDLSCGSMIAFSGSMCAMVMLLLAPDEMHEGRLSAGVIAAGVGAALASGFLVGSLHAWLITVIRLPPFIATLATLVGLRSLARAMIEYATSHAEGARSGNIYLNDENFRYLTKSVWIPVAIFLVLSAAAWVLLSRTVIGRRLHALGGNEQAARLSGIRVERLKWLAYCLGSMLASVAGVLYICEQSTADPQTLGAGYELNAIAAAVVGGCSLRGGVGTIPGVMLGCLFLRSVTDGIAKIIKTGSDLYEGAIVGVVVVLAVAFNQLRRQAGLLGKLLPGALGWVTILNLTLIAFALSLLLFDRPLAGVIGGGFSLATLGAIKAWEATRSA